jgi:RES domain-containing protein
VTLHRLSRIGFATLTGAGSALYPGRWNRRGQRAIYTSTEKAACVLERLVHQKDKLLIPSNVVMMEIHLSGDWVKHETHLVDKRTGAKFLRFPSLQEAERISLEPGESFVIAVAVPSVVVSVWNVVLYPEAPNFFKHVSVKTMETFKFDPRLFPHGAVEEALEGAMQRS